MMFRGTVKDWLPLQDLCPSPRIHVQGPYSSASPLLSIAEVARLSGDRLNSMASRCVEQSSSARSPIQPELTEY